MKNRISLIAASIILVSASLSGQVNVDFGSKAGMASYLNQSNRPGNDLFEIGPRSFRLLNDELWLLDTVGDKFIIFDKSGKMLRETVFARKNEKILAEDFAPVFSGEGNLEAIWVINGFAGNLFKISPDGKMIDELKAGELLQPMRIEVDVAGHIMVTDDAAQALHVFNKDKKLLASLEYEWSGLAVSDDGTSLYRLKFDSKKQITSLLKSQPDGKSPSLVALEIGKHFNPQLWWVNNKNGDIFVSYQVEGLEPGEIMIARFNANGQIAGRVQFRLPVSMTRFADHESFTQMWLGAADYRNAPEGTLQIYKNPLP